MQLRSDSLPRNIAANAAGYLVTLAAAFVMFPVMFHRLGAARYGLWLLISEFTGYYNYVGLGIRAGVVYYGALHLARDEQQNLNQVLSTAIWSLTAVGAVLGLSSFGLAAIFPLMFGATGLDPRETYRAIVIMAFAVALSLPIEAMNSALTAAKRLDVVNGIDVATRTASSLAMIVCVLEGCGLVTLSLIQLGVKVVTAPCTYMAMRRIIPRLSLSLTNASFDSLKRLGRFGLPSVLIGLGWMVNSRTDLLVVAAVIGVPMVAYYAVPRSLMEYADAGIRSIAWSFTSHLTHLHAQDKSGDTIKLYLQGSRIISSAVFLLTAYIAAFGTSFLSVWQGTAFVAGPWRNRSSIVLLILIAAFLPRLIQNMATQLFYATNRLTFLMWISLLEGAIKISLSLLLVTRWGLAGVAVSNLIPMVFFEGLAIPAYLFRNYPVQPGAYFRDVIVRPLFAGLTAYLVSAAMVFWRPPRDWPLFVLEASLAALVGLAATVAIGFKAGEFEVWWRRMTGGGQLLAGGTEAVGGYNIERKKEESRP